MASAIFISDASELLALDDFKYIHFCSCLTHLEMLLSGTTLCERMLGRAWKGCFHVLNKRCGVCDVSLTIHLEITANMAPFHYRNSAGGKCDVLGWLTSTEALWLPLWEMAHCSVRDNIQSAASLHHLFCSNDQLTAQCPVIIGLLNHKYVDDGKFEFKLMYNYLYIVIRQRKNNEVSGFNYFCFLQSAIVSNLIINVYYINYFIIWNRLLTWFF